ncbi:MAG: xanthine dehydrogenase family protein subunit M [Solirubrobacteraceae bacterium]|nr:xanthine dehydrogenase family protein subunit M [Solirubrobacteraceae bacterium]
MKPSPFRYARPASAQEAVALLSQWEGLARVLAGGQSLVPMMHMRLVRPALIVDVNRISGLDRIVTTGSETRVGALVRYSALEDSALIAERLPLLTTATRHIGDRQVRNRGTIGGSLCQADPTGEIPLVALALGARVVALSVRGEREIPVAELIEGSYATTLAFDELVTEIRFPPAPESCTMVEVTRKHNDFAVLAVCALGDPQTGGRWTGVRIALGGADETPVLMTQAAMMLDGTTLDDGLIDAAAEHCSAAVDPPDDIRASAEYRQHLVGEHVRRALRRLREERVTVDV